MATTQETFVQYPENVRVSYLVALAAIATADHENSPEEMAFMEQVATAAQLSQAGAQQVVTAMKNPAGANLSQHLNLLNQSDIKFSLVADILNLVYADGELDKEEVAQIQNFANILGISPDQLGALGQYVVKANKNAESQEGNPGMLGFLSDPKTLALAGSFLSQSGLLDSFTKSGIPTGNFNSGSTFATALTGIASSLLQGQMGGQSAGSQSGGMDLGGMLGALSGSGTSGSSQAGGGLGGMLSGVLQSQAGQQAIGGLLSQVMGTSQQGNGLGSLGSLLGGGQSKPAQNSGGLGSLLNMLL